ncbi:MAG: shikimate dehydrogenase [Burkholderiales bacterium]|nr:shikimate dehydrogenase [Burkholderiales bacterium]
MADRYAVVGNPVAHSKSPDIHAMFARETGEDLVYERLLAPLDRFVETVQAFRRAGGRGCNVTVPFKGEAFRFAGEHSERARVAEAVNVLRFDGDRVFGDNSDGVGLLRDIEHNLGVPLRGRRVLLLGAGGAAQGVLGPLLSAGPARVAIGNRTLEKAERLAARFRQAGAAAGPCARSFEALAGEAFDVVVNATSASLDDAELALPAGLFAPGALAYDMMYGKGMTPFLRAARTEGAALLADGLGMLVEQAAESFLVWRGVRPDTANVLASLRAS